MKVYAFGLYVDPAGARSSLSAFAGVSMSRLERDQSFYRRILDMNFSMALRLVMTRDVAGDAVAEAFDRALRPRVERAAADMNMPGGAAALEQFRGYFNLREVPKGTRSSSPAARPDASGPRSMEHCAPESSRRPFAGRCSTSTSVRGRFRLTARRA